MYIDSHAHFNLIIEEGLTISELLEQMRQHEITTAVQIGTDIESTLWSRDFAAANSAIYYTAGLHPEHRFDSERTTELVSTIDTCCEDQKCIAIGEIGLDYHYPGFDKQNQQLLLEIQLQSANQNDMPLVIHSRDAMDDTLAILDNFSPERVLFHCFGGTRDDAEKVIDRGWYISFAGNLTFKKAVDLQQAAAYIPLDRLLLETDAPYLSPVPVRGKTNVPANVRHTYAFAAQLRNSGVDELATAIESNFYNFFIRTKR